MRTLFTRPKPFLDAARRDWQFATFAWLLRNSGGYSKFLDTTLVLPTSEHFPVSGAKGRAGIAALFRRVRDHAGMAEWPCSVEPETAPEEHRRSTAIPVIRYPADDLEPGALIATFARELARQFVETFEEPAPGGGSLFEPGIDVAAIFMGFGVFLANATCAGTRFALNEGEAAHALAMFCLLRNLETAPIGTYLNPHLRKHLRLAARDLGQHARAFKALRATVAVHPEVAECARPV